MVNFLKVLHEQQRVLLLARAEYIATLDTGGPHLQLILITEIHNDGVVLLGSELQNLKHGFITASLLGRFIFINFTHEVFQLLLALVHNLGQRLFQSEFIAIVEVELADDLAVVPLLCVFLEARKDILELGV